MLRQGHLQRALSRAGPLRKDVQNQRRAVDYLHLQRLFQGALLGRRELVVEHRHVVAQR